MFFFGRWNYGSSERKIVKDWPWRLECLIHNAYRDLWTRQNRLVARCVRRRREELLSEKTVDKTRDRDIPHITASIDSLKRHPHISNIKHFPIWDLFLNGYSDNTVLKKGNRAFVRWYLRIFSHKPLIYYFLWRFNGISFLNTVHTWLHLDSYQSKNSVIEHEIVNIPLKISFAKNIPPLFAMNTKMNS